jgi:hypothetical protein
MTGFLESYTCQTKLIEPLFSQTLNKKQEFSAILLNVIVPIKLELASNSAN